MVLGDISCGKDERIRGASLGIHHDPAPGFQPRVTRQLQIEIDADPHHHCIKGFTVAVAVDDRQAAVVLQLQRAAAGTDLHPCSRWMASRRCDTSPLTERMHSAGCCSNSVTATQLFRAEAAISRPIQPPPIIASL